MATKEKEISRGKEAHRIIDDDLFQEAFVDLKKIYMEEWENSPARDQEARESLWMAIKMLGAVKDHLTTIMETGKLADRQLEEMARESSAMRGVAK